MRLNPFGTLGLARLLAPLLASGLVLTGALGGERSASAGEEVVTVAPPAPLVEYVSAAPSPRHFWTPGYWGYHPGYGHRWYAGSWQAYRPGYTWAQPGWSRCGAGWTFHHGGWGHGGGWSHGGHR
jgi:hypothetical protein